MSMQFKNPPGTASTVGSQIVNQYYAKKALVELPKLTFFTQLADVTSMPKNYGKKIKRYHYMPLLDDRNINDQGLDASGAAYANGNLYGSSKDIGTIPGKMPALSETGGRVNRVGFKRIELEGTLEKFGFFDEYTQESMDFDTDEQLMEHINREMILGANEIIEDSLQIDLISSAGVVRYAGAATSNATIDENCVVTYGDLMRTSIQLDQNRCPKQTKIITGSRMIDTKTIPSARVAYIGSELLPVFKAMKDLHNNPAFIGVERYGDAVGTTLNGEIGTVDQFRLVVHPEMMKWAGAGATADDASFHATAGKYDVFPILVVGDESFTTIGFQTDGKTVKFKIMHKAPGEATANQLDPYGETGFMSIKWYYGFMCLRPERIALIKTAAKM